MLLPFCVFLSKGQIGNGQVLKASFEQLRRMSTVVEDYAQFGVNASPDAALEATIRLRVIAKTQILSDDKGG